uniref:Uncharacterized protein n=1 Tax=Utricularia reniformis TaxID=192314 RepID=A0A1Y0B081_9LAMI|nr:hypothetical protein AEK19_MT0548 [Utricularia reniformis]ART30803.1 hypothetical protein AEK19_MT0548 [Utricularia reniformis]
MLVDRIFHYSSMIQSILSYFLPFHYIFEVAIVIKKNLFNRFLIHRYYIGFESDFGSIYID